MNKDLVWITVGHAQEVEPMARTEIIEQYQRAFNVINARMFDGSLPPIEILPGNEFDGDLSDGLACFVSDTDRVIPPKIYLQFDNPAEYGMDNDDISNLFHEMIHYLNYVKHLEKVDPDCVGPYHTESFKKAIEEHGGVSEYIDPKYGYSGELPEKTAWEIWWAIQDEL